MDCNVRRCLFGPVDREQLHRDLKMNHHELFLEACRRWNFDFQIDTPLPGMFVWEKISGGCTATFYQTQRKCSAPVLAADDQDMEGWSAQENRPGFSNYPGEVTPVRGKRTRPKSKENAQTLLERGGRLQKANPQTFIPSASKQLCANQ
ncbi:cyclin-dependent kinase inhibitor 1B-like [Syngnathus typhle]|uniref:cyclin-dependent kinase inhibitor 1B-like n=1 Tax=Syngnathus typhle TaxID=161592 RepID=UPI002A698EC7|nr:cyclin-dependent kinase inhibitor 1B-like [Syngnathus typhle]